MEIMHPKVTLKQFSGEERKFLIELVEKGGPEPHILLMLKKMLKKEGLETIREMKRLQPELKIIAMSGGGKISAENYLGTAKIFGAAKVLEKPFTKDEMVSTVEELLKDD